MCSLASVIENQQPRSISGISSNLPERGGHSILHLLLTSLAGSQSPSTAQALTIFPPDCFTAPKSSSFPCAINAVSSKNSRLAASNGSSSAAYSPFGIDHAPRSFFAQKGPPGWTRNTSAWPCRLLYINSPALN